MYGRRRDETGRFWLPGVGDAGTSLIRGGSGFWQALDGASGSGSAILPLCLSLGPGDSVACLLSLGDRVPKGTRCLPVTLTLTRDHNRDHSARFAFMFFVFF